VKKPWDDASDDKLGAWLRKAQEPGLQGARPARSCEGFRAARPQVGRCDRRRTFSQTRVRSRSGSAGVGWIGSPGSLPPLGFSAPEISIL